MNSFKILIIGIIICSAFLTTFAQVGIGTETPDPSSALDITSTDRGLLIPRVDSSAITSPAAGLMIYQPADNGFYFYNGSKWQLLGSVSSATLSDIDGDTKIQVEETADEDVIRFDFAGTEKWKLLSDSTGRSRIEWLDNKDNIAIGGSTLEKNTFGNCNVAVGASALKQNT